MPDPSSIHGRAIPAAELGDGVVTVRVVREAIGNNVPGQQVVVIIGNAKIGGTTDAQGRAEFGNLSRGDEARAEVTVDGERLVSQPFTVPTTGGLRVILIAGMARAAERKKQEEAAAAAGPAVKGVVVFGGNTRVLMQFRDDSLEVYYVLEILNTARSRVDIGGPLTLDFPPGATGTTLLEGSSPSATLSPERVVIAGPFASGTTLVQVAFRMPYTRSELTLEQTWPAALQQVTVGVEKVVNNLSISSPQFTSANDVTAEAGSVFVLGRGPALQAGGTTRVTLSNLPVQSPMPRYVTFALAIVLAGVGVWLATTKLGRDDARAALAKRRDVLLGQLEQLEAKRQGGTVEGSAYLTRRQKMYAELERIYGELDEVAGPEGGGEGVAA
jgi:hypothetical protein